MSISVFDLFSIGIGPSSSHTVGPMRAAKLFLEKLKLANTLETVSSIKVELYGSLALTGKGHGTNTAVLLGLEGQDPTTVDPKQVPKRIDTIAASKMLLLDDHQPIGFNEDKDIIFHKTKLLPFHSNGMRFSVYDQSHNIIDTNVYYSVGGGFVVDEQILAAKPVAKKDNCLIENCPFPFSNSEQLLSHCLDNNLTIAQVVLANEEVHGSTEEIRKKLLAIWEVMHQSIINGCKEEGILPGVLKIKRRAPQLYKKLHKQSVMHTKHIEDMDWLSLYAIAVNEENAAGKRIVTAPTNGAAGVIPAVLNYHIQFEPNIKEEDIITFLLTAAAIGMLYKQGASLSAAEVGCQGEVGVACSMAAGAYAAVRGGSIAQIENAAEIAMEHNLGLTCDPIAGLVQIPCIERNAMGAVQAVNAARLALLGDGSHKVSLDEVIATMRQTGKDMSHKYKETSKGGLAVNVPEC